MKTILTVVVAAAAGTILGALLLRPFPARAQASDPLHITYVRSPWKSPSIAVPGKVPGFACTKWVPGALNMKESEPRCFVLSR